MLHAADNDQKSQPKLWGTHPPSELQPVIYLRCTLEVTNKEIVHLFYRKMPTEGVMEKSEQQML